MRTLEGLALWLCGLLFVAMVAFAIRGLLKWYDFAMYLFGR